MQTFVSFVFSVTFWEYLQAQWRRRGEGLNDGFGILKRFPSAVLLFIIIVIIALDFHYTFLKCIRTNTFHNTISVECVLYIVLKNKIHFQRIRPVARVLVRGPFKRGGDNDVIEHL